MRAWLRLVVVASIALGVYFRFADLGKKVYWGDEIYSAFRVFGYRQAEVMEMSSEARNVAQLRAVLHPTLAERGGTGRTIETLAAVEPQHSPLYFVLANWWSGVFGTSLASLRSISAVFSVLSLAAMYWLGVELFGASLAVWIAVALLAVSPIQVIYAQEFREYSLWTTGTIVMTACLLRAMRVWNLASWTLYAAVLAVNLYVYPPSGAIGAAQLLFVALHDRWRGRGLGYPLAAGLLGLAVFLPWLITIVRGLPQVEDMMRMVIVPRVSPLQTLRSFLSAVRLDFFDFNLLKAVTVNASMEIPAVALVAYSVYVTCRQAPTKVRGIIVATMAASMLPVVVPDLVWSGIRTTQIRYYLPFFLAVDLAIAFVIAARLTTGSSSSRQAWAALLTAVLAVRFGSMFASSRADTWWNKIQEQSITIARIINQTPDAVIVSDDHVADALSLAEYLRPDIPTRLSYRHGSSDAAQIETAGLEGKHIFMIGPSKALQRRINAVPHVTTTCIVGANPTCANGLTMWGRPAIR